MADAAAEGPASRPRISVKFSPVGRVQRFLLPELLPGSPGPASGPGGSAIGTVAAGAGVSGAPASSLSSPSSPSSVGSMPPGAAAGQDPGVEPRWDAPLRPGDAVMIRTLDGPALAHVQRSSAAAVESRSPTQPPGQQVIRRATEADVVLRLKQQQREREGHRVCSRRIRERGLAMKLSRVEHAFDGSRLIFYFTADGRIDFRELVRDLAAEFRMRIEMRQIGVRDEARMLGGYGSCGRPLCCTTWLQSFEPVSIKMAKQQNLSLNPSKLSGLCGRLKCCLRYELPNGKGEQFAGCAQQGGCSGEGCSGGGACGSGGCGACGT